MQQTFPLRVLLKDILIFLEIIGQARRTLTGKDFFGVDHVDDEVPVNPSAR